MKSIIVALVFALAITANCGLLKNVPQRAPVLSLAEINQHPLGKSILSLMSLHMKAQGPLEDLTDLLQEIFDEVTAQNEQNEAQHSADSADCDSRQTALEGLIYGLGQEFATQTTLKVDNENALADLRPQLDGSQTSLETTEDRITEGTAEREARHAQYESDLADNQDAIAAVREALTLLNSLKAGTSFVQLKGRMAKVQERLSNTKSSKHAHIYTPLLKALAQITSKADKEIIERIISLLENLLSQLTDAASTIQSTEDAEAAAWETELEYLTSEQARLSALIDQLTDDITTREGIVADSTDRADRALEGVSTETQNYIDTKAECEAKEQAYETLRDELGHELELLAELQNHFSQKFAGLNEYINSAPAL